MMKEKIYNYSIEMEIDEITKFLIQDYNLNIDQAIDFIYNSDTYQKLVNMPTGLYTQSPAYISVAGE